MTSEDSLRNAKCKYFVESIENLAKIFEDVNILKNSVAICINKVRERKLKNNARSLFDDLYFRIWTSGVQTEIVRECVGKTYVSQMLEFR